MRPPDEAAIPKTEDYIRFYNSGSGIGGITAATFQAYWCGAVAPTAAEYSDCTRQAAAVVG